MQPLTTHFALQALSPLDGRYNSQLVDLAHLFSEEHLIQTRFTIEVKYLLFLSGHGCIPRFSLEDEKRIHGFVEDFSMQDALLVKEHEKRTKHDVKAVEYLLRDKMDAANISGSHYIHVALTSEDVNSLAYSLLIAEGKRVLITTLRRLLSELAAMSEEYADVPMLARTHGQEAVATTVGKELAVFATRLFHELLTLDAQHIDAKLTGAVGNFNAHTVAFPKHNWIDLSQKFVSSLDLKPNIMTTQILPTESYLECFSSLIRVNGILLDLNQDIWRYISDHAFGQKVEKEQVGSSTMPQKVNPIDFENSEGNLGLANALLIFFIQKLPVSRLQRDLSDSTVKRSIGTAFGYCQLAYLSLLKGLPKLTVNTQKLHQELSEHWEVLAEALQVVLRVEGDEDGYEKLRVFSQGKQLTEKDLSEFIRGLALPPETQARLLTLRPETYLGLAPELTTDAVQPIKAYLKGVS